MKKRYLLLTVMIFAYGIYHIWYQESDPAPDFFNTKFLRNSNAVQKILQQEGFENVTFETQDQLTLHASFLDKSHKQTVQATIISCPGFVPGRKEGMSTLYAMFKEEPYNFIFLDLRGHGPSQGELLTYRGIKHYGEHEYLDIVATINFIMLYNQQHHINQDIIIHGLCSGAFHTIKAVHYLQHHNPDAYKAVKGVIFDSGWPSVPDIVESTLTSEAHKRCCESYVPYLAYPLSACVVSIYNYFFKSYHCQQTSIVQALQEIEQPILFIHAENDTYIPIKHVYPLIKEAQKSSSWIIKESTHAAHHLKHTDAYTTKMKNFIESVLLMTT